MGYQPLVDYLCFPEALQVGDRVTVGSTEVRMMGLL